MRPPGFWIRAYLPWGAGGENTKLFVVANTPAPVVMSAQGLKTLCLDWRVLTEKSDGMVFNKSLLKEIQEWYLVFKTPQNTLKCGGAATYKFAAWVIPYLLDISSDSHDSPSKHHRINVCASQNTGIAKAFCTFNHLCSYIICILYYMYIYESYLCPHGSAPLLKRSGGRSWSFKQSFSHILWHLALSLYKAQ